jgi:hypothetical protein
LKKAFLGYTNLVDELPLRVIGARAALIPPIMPNIKPNTKPPPVNTLGAENMATIIPHNFLLEGFIFSILAPISTRHPRVKLRIISTLNGTDDYYQTLEAPVLCVGTT